jgi:hypothetical protein
MEVLVSLTLMSVLFVAVHYGYRIGLDSWSRAEKSMEKERNVQFVLDLMSRQLGSMVPYYSRQTLEGAPVDVLLFYGTEQGVRFVTTFSVELRGAAGLRMVEYFLDSSREGVGKALLLNEMLLPDDVNLASTVFGGLSRGEDNSVVAAFRGFTAGVGTVALVEGLSNGSFQFPRSPGKDQAASGSVDSTEEVMAGRLGIFMMTERESSGTVTANRKERLPLGVELKLRWLESGFFHAEEFAMSVPVQASF